MSKIKSIKYVGKKPVYNMNVEDLHNFLIQGGIVSHNCDALRYFCVYWINPAVSVKTGKEVKWTEDMKQDYENESAEMRKLIEEQWGVPS
jgi:hypothetical protein